MANSKIDNLTISEVRELSQMFGGLEMAPTAMAKSLSGPERAVLVTTEHRGVFFGYATNTDGDTIVLKRARNCVYWPAGTKGFLGLASEGPGKGSRVGPPADIQLRKITCVAEVTEIAAKTWEAAPWSN